MEEEYNLEYSGESLSSEVESKPIKNEQVLLVFESCLRVLLAIRSKCGA